MEAFKRVGCLQFCEKLHGCHTQILKEFAMNFNGTATKVGMLSMSITTENISTVTEIPRGQETWFKGFKFDMEKCKEFMKLEYANMDLNNAIPRSCIKENLFKAATQHSKVFYMWRKDIIRFTHIISSCFCISLVRFHLICLFIYTGDLQKWLIKYKKNLKVWNILVSSWFNEVIDFRWTLENRQGLVIFLVYKWFWVGNPKPCKKPRN